MQRNISPMSPTIRPRMFAALLILSACTCCASACQSTKDSAGNTNTSAPVDAPATEQITTKTFDADARAQEILTLFREGDTKKIRAMFSKDMLAALDEAKTATIWPSIEGLAGPFRGVMLSRTETKDDLTRVSLTCEFEKMPMMIRVVFDADQNIAGLNGSPASDPAAFPPRPQTPSPPFPYTSINVTYKNPTDQSTLAATLTLPEAPGPHPAVLLITGSGAQDRDETLFGHKPFLVIADRLTRDGVAVLRVDDRGVGGSTGDPNAATIPIHATDVEAGIAFLKSRTDIDPKRVGLIGHSEGGILAALVAARPASGVAFIVSLAGTGLPGTEINPLQMEAIMRADGSIPEAGIPELIAAQRHIITLVIQGAAPAEISAAIVAAQKLSLKYNPNPNQTPTDEALNTEAASQTQMLLSPWFQSFLRTDPAESWKVLTCPALVMIGTKDLQVPAEPNLAAIKAATQHNTHVQFEKLEGLNHLFQKAETGLVSEYAKIAQTFDPLALDVLGVWVKQQAGLQAP